MRLLVAVEHVFTIKDRGIIVYGDLAGSRHTPFRVGDSVQIRCQSGSVIQSVISGIPIRTIEAGKTELLLGGISNVDMVKPGDEVWVGDTSA